MKSAWLLLLFALSGIAQAQRVDNPGIGLFSQCTVAVNPSYPPTTPPTIKCLNYIDGWLDGISGTFLPDDKGNLQAVTVKGGLTAIQAATAFNLYMTDHPEEKQKPRNVALLDAMLNAGFVTIASPGK
jgi:hypothetical protein